MGGKSAETIFEGSSFSKENLKGLFQGSFRGEKFNSEKKRFWVRTFNKNIPSFKVNSKKTITIYRHTEHSIRE